MLFHIFERKGKHRVEEESSSEDFDLVKRFVKEKYSEAAHDTENILTKYKTVLHSIRF